MLSLGLTWWSLILILLIGDIETDPGPTQVISGLLLNTRSVSSVNQDHNKLVDLQASASLKESRIVCLTETWLDAAFFNSEILPNSSFNVYRCGCVLVAIH